MLLFFPQIKEITLELLKVLQQTENDDITSVVQKVIATYFDKLAPIMYDICQNLVCILIIISIIVLPHTFKSNIKLIVLL